MERLTIDVATSTAMGWVERYSRAHALGTQRHWLLSEAARLCAVEAVKREGDAEMVSLLYNEAFELLHSIWHLTAPAVATKWWRDGEVPSESEKRDIAESKAILWRRRDPRVAYVEGFTSSEHFSCDKASLDSNITSYLTKPWMRHPALDFILLDQLNTSETCAFGEAIKEKFYPTKNRDCVGLINDRYHKSKGRLADLQKEDKDARSDAWAYWLLFYIVLPAVATWAAFHLNFVTTGLVFAGLWSLLWLAEVLMLLARGLSRLFRGPAPPIAHQKHYQVWKAMCDVWSMLDGPVVNPTRMKDAMTRSAEAGVIWDNAAWALIDRVIQHDPAVWIIQRA